MRRKYSNDLPFIISLSLLFLILFFGGGGLAKLVKANYPIGLVQVSSSTPTPTDTTTSTSVHSSIQIPTKTYTPTFTITPTDSASEAEILTATAATKYTATAAIRDTTTTEAIQAVTAQATATAKANQAATAQANQTATIKAIQTGIAVAEVRATATADYLHPIRLIDPPNNAVFEGVSNDIIFQWTWDGVLQADEYFFIEARFTGVNQRQICETDWLYFKWTKETRAPVDIWLYDAICPSPTERTVQWTVSVAKPIAGLEEPDRVQLKPVSEIWRFQWLQAGGSNIQGTPTPGRGIIRPP